MGGFDYTNNIYFCETAKRPPKRMRAYLSHLIQVNDIQPVSARIDIVSKSGETLVTKGTNIDQSAAETIGTHPLDLPISHYITLEEQFTADTIYSLFMEFVTSDPALNELHEQRELEEKYIDCVEAFCTYDALRQTLNVLAIQLPDVFDQALFCAWMVVTIMASENQPQFRLNNAFIAALSHDLGLLNVDPNILFKTDALSSEEWVNMQQHPKHSAALLKSLPGIDKESVVAVLEHHEVIDGTGYPSGKASHQLGELGQLLYQLDSINAIYRKHYKTRQRSLHDMVPIIQMCTLSRDGIHTDALAALFNSTASTEHCTIAEEVIPSAISLVKANAEELSQFASITAEFSKTVGTKHRDLNLLGLQNIARMIRSTLSSCGIINDAYMRWLDQVGEEKLVFAYRELEDVLLMTQEIKFHIQRYHRQVAVYLSKPSTPEVSEHVANLQAELNGIPRSETNENDLIEYLQGKTAGC